MLAVTLLEAGNLSGAEGLEDATDQGGGAPSDYEKGGPAVPERLLREALDALPTQGQDDERDSGGRIGLSRCLSVCMFFGYQARDFMLICSWHSMAI